MQNIVKKVFPHTNHSSRKNFNAVWLNFLARYFFIKHQQKKSKACQAVGKSKQVKNYGEVCQILTIKANLSVRENSEKHVVTRRRSQDYLQNSSAV